MFNVGRRRVWKNSRENLTNCHQCEADTLDATLAAQMSGEVNLSLDEEKTLVSLTKTLRSLQKKKRARTAHQLLARLRHKLN